MAKVNVTDTLKAPFELLKKYPIVGIPPLLSALVSLIVILVTFRGGIFLSGFRFFILSIFEWIVVLLMQGWLVAILDEILTQGTVDLRKSWFRVVEQIGNLLITSFIISILTSIGLILFIIPGIIIMISFAVSVPAIVKKKLGIIDSMKESINFTYSQGNFWIIFLIVVIGILISFIPFIGSVLGSFLVSLWIPYAYLKYSE
ncbi:MAG: hypothetical protein PWQ20_283 [Thermotogaceae bacterium]|jgi:hypothetical protein|nr:hypothetical protein [Thermotogaceae bacterium]MDN5337213.1 hypothetical protein [Thermotogaceae bacterium]